MAKSKDNLPEEDKKKDKKDKKPRSPKEEKYEGSRYASVFLLIATVFSSLLFYFLGSR